MAIKLSQIERFHFNRWSLTCQDFDQIVRRVRIRAAESTAERRAQIERLELAGCVDQAAALKAEQAPAPFSRVSVLAAHCGLAFGEPRDVVSGHVSRSISPSLATKLARHAASVGPNAGPRPTAKRAHRAYLATFVAGGHVRPFGLKEWLKRSPEAAPFRASFLAGKAAAHQPGKAAAPRLKPASVVRAKAAKPDASDVPKGKRGRG